MVLNLLNTRSLEEARGFLDRSFSAYLGGIGKQVGVGVGMQGNSVRLGSARALSWHYVSEGPHCL